MGSNVDRIKERLDIADVISAYVKLEKSGSNFKAKCPFHNEKTPSFYVSPTRQGFYCFGCGAKGDMFNFIEEIEGVDFRGALKLLADKAGVVVEYQSQELKTEKDKILEAIGISAEFFEKGIKDKQEVRDYLIRRGVDEESIRKWRIGYAPDGWRNLYSELISLGLSQGILIKAGLVKQVEGDLKKNPYDVFRGRIIFPLSDRAGRIIAFSGRALHKENEPKYLNSPDTVVFTKGEILYGFDKAKEEIRKKNYTVLVEGQLDLVLSHQAGVINTVATSGTAFTPAHLELLKRLSPRIILAFDGDMAGEKAARRSTELGLSLGMEVKIANLPVGKDPADIIQEDPSEWKKILRDSVPAIEYFLTRILEREKDERKVGKLIEGNLLPLVAMVEGAIERSHYVGLIAKRTGIKEEMLWEDLRRTKMPEVERRGEARDDMGRIVKYPRKTNIERRLLGIIFWQESLPHPDVDISSLKGEIAKRVGQEYFEKLVTLLEAEKEVLIFEAESYYASAEKLSGDIVELLDNLSDDVLRGRLARLLAELSHAEMVKDQELSSRLSQEIQVLHKEMATLEDVRKKM